MKKKMNYLILLLTILLMVGCTNSEDASIIDVETDSQKSIIEEEETVTKVIEKEEVEEPEVQEKPVQPKKEPFSGYKLIEVDGGDLSGYRESNVVVDIGYGDRKYWGFNNEHGQLIRVIADKITLQDD